MNLENDKRRRTGKTLELLYVLFLASVFPLFLLELEVVFAIIVL